MEKTDGPRRNKATRAICFQGAGVQPEDRRLGRPTGRPWEFPEGAPCGIIKEEGDMAMARDGRCPMKALRPIQRIAPALVVLHCLAAVALAQYQVPLRYDLRYSSPTYIPSDVMRGAPPPPPARQDPYAFGSLSYGDLGVTGNLRAGKSFQGNVPYTQLGNIVSNDLPSYSLSNFERDSIGVGDIGTGVERGVPTPYFPGSGSVTTPGTVGVRFAVPPLSDRAPYTVADLNAALPQARARVGVDTGEARLPAEGVPAAGYGLTIPQSALNWVDALIEGRVSPQSAPGGEEASKTDQRLGLLQESPDRRLGLKPETATESPWKPEKQAEEQAIEDSESSLYQRVRKEVEEAKQESSEPAKSTAAPSVRSRPGGEEDASALEGREEKPGGIPPPAKPYKSAGGFDGYLKRADAAVKESNYSKAEALYAAAAALEPNRPVAFFGRLHALLGLMYYDQAGVVLEQTLKAHPDWVKAAPEIMSVYPNAEVLERIIRDLKANLLVKPDSLSDGLLLGYVLYSAGRRDEAKAFLEAVARVRGEEQGPEQAILKAIEGR